MNRIFRFFHLTFILSLTLIVTACGFHLRGNISLPEGVEPLYVSGVEANSQLGVELSSLLKASNIQLAESAEKANYKLVISQYKTDRRTTALGEGARIAEYQLIEELNFSLQNPNGETVLGPNKITERKIIPNDPNQIISTTEEAKLLRREMIQNLAVKITRQLSVYDYKKSE
jgi:LPS-assembly lipoprotein